MAATAPLSGTVVIDMGWLMAAPEASRFLADLGATVIKIESKGRPDPLRSLGAFKNGVRDPEKSISYHAINAGKLGVAINLKHPAGHEAILDLVKKADVLIEGFTPGVADSLKLSYDYLSKVNPRLVVVSSSILGASGTYSKGTSGFGTSGSAFCGATHLMGWPDLEPEGPAGPWTDGVAPRFTAAAVISALRYRQKTGRGCLIDVSQAETGIQFLMPAYFEYAVNGHVPQRRGVAGSPLRCPSGVYPCKGEDRWVAIDGSDEEGWLGLRTIVPGLENSLYDTLVGRLRNRVDIDNAITAFTRIHEADEIESILQAVGTSSHQVARPQDLAADPDLVAQDYYRTAIDPVMGEFVTRGPQFRLSRTPTVPTVAGPRIGSSTIEVMTELVGYSKEKVEALQAEGALS